MQGLEADRFHYLETPSDLSADEFLKHRLKFLEDYFSYDKLAGLSMAELRRQRRIFLACASDMEYKFVDRNYIFADDLDIANAIFDDWDFYEPLSQNQRDQITISYNKINRSFDKAKEEATDRKLERYEAIFSMIPVLGRFTG